MRLTRAPRRSLASATNAGVTPAPPLETSRRVSTRRRGERGCAHQRDEEGGGADHERDPLRLDGAQRPFRVPSGHEVGGHRHHAGDEHRVEEAGHVRERRRHQHRVVGAELVGAGHDLRLVREAPLGVQRGLRAAARPGGEEHHGQVGGTGRRLGDRRCRVEQRVEAATRVGDVRWGQPQSGLEHREHPFDLDRAGLMVDRPRDRAQPPAGPVQDDDLVAVRGLPGHDVTPPDPRRPQPAGQSRHRGLEGRAGEGRARVVEDQGAGRAGRGAGQHRVEARPVPRAARRAVGAGVRVLVGRSQLSGLRHDAPTGVAPRTSCEPMKFRWISTVPAPMHSPRMSR